MDKRKVVVGIDPGKHGAIGIIDRKGEFVEYYKLNDPSPEDIFVLLNDIAKRFDVVCVGLEHVHARSGEGVRSTATFMEHKGVIKGVLTCLQLPYTEIPPQVWKKLSPELKKAKGESKIEAKKRSLTYAQKRWPEAYLYMVKHIDVAEALCIAEYTSMRKPDFEVLEELKQKRLEEARESYNKNRDNKQELLEQAKMKMAQRRESEERKKAEALEDARRQMAQKRAESDDG